MDLCFAFDFCEPRIRERDTPFLCRSVLLDVHLLTLAPDVEGGFDGSIQRRDLDAGRVSVVQLIDLQCETIAEVVIGQVGTSPNWNHRVWTNEQRQAQKLKC